SNFFFPYHLQKLTNGQSIPNRPTVRQRMVPPRMRRPCRRPQPNRQMVLSRLSHQAEQRPRRHRQDGILTTVISPRPSSLPLVILLLSFLSSSNLFVR